MFSWKSLQFNVQSVVSLHQSVYHETVKTVKKKEQKKEQYKYAAVSKMLSSQTHVGR